MNCVNLLPPQLVIVVEASEVQQLHKIAVMDFQSVNLVEAQPVLKSLLLRVVKICREGRFLDIFDCLKVSPCLAVLAASSGDVVDAPNLSIVIEVGCVDPERLLQGVSFVSSSC